MINPIEDRTFVRVLSYKKNDNIFIGVPNRQTYDIGRKVVKFVNGLDVEVSDYNGSFYIHSIYNKGDGYKDWGWWIYRSFK